jgi:hypothetical protein
MYMEEMCGRRRRRYGTWLIALPLLGVFVCPVTTDITGKSNKTFISSNGCQSRKVNVNIPVA